MSHERPNHTNSQPFICVQSRPAASHEAGHPTGSVNVPLYQPITFERGYDFRTVMKAVAYAANGVPAIEANPDFIKQLKAVANGKGVITMVRTRV